MSENSLLPECQTVAKKPQGGAQILIKLDAELGIDTAQTLKDSVPTGANFITVGAATVWEIGAKDITESGGNPFGEMMTLLVDQDTEIQASSPLSPGKTISLKIKHSTGAPFAITFNTFFKFAGDTPPVLTDVAGKTDILTFASHNDGLTGVLYLTSVSLDVAG